jgi:hypothetical protein
MAPPFGEADLSSGRPLAKGVVCGWGVWDHLAARRWRTGGGARQARWPAGGRPWAACRASTAAARP